jgi:hypothetical protein
LRGKDWQRHPGHFLLRQDTAANLGAWPKGMLCPMDKARASGLFFVHRPAGSRVACPMHACTSRAAGGFGGHGTHAAST